MLRWSYDRLTQAINDARAQGFGRAPLVVRLAIAHGQMPERELERVMRDFVAQRHNVLLCSTIIETGIDVPTANTIVISRADKFGLAQLHQLRVVTVDLERRVLDVESGAHQGLELVQDAAHVVGRERRHGVRSLFGGRRGRAAGGRVFRRALSPRRRAALDLGGRGDASAAGKRAPCTGRYAVHKATGGLMLALATVGFAINFWAWALLSPLGAYFKQALGLTSFQQALLVAVPVIVGALGRIPVGALTDRYGGRVMFPVVSFATIVPVLFLGLAGYQSLTMLLAGGFFLGVAGTSFAVGSLADTESDRGRCRAAPRRWQDCD